MPYQSDPLSGIAGIGAVAMYSINVENVFMKLMMPRLDWGFYIYAAGAGVTTVSSFMLCFASPQNPLTNVVSYPSCQGAAFSCFSCISFCFYFWQVLLGHSLLKNYLPIMLQQTAPGNKIYGGLYLPTVLFSHPMPTIFCN